MPIGDLLAEISGGPGDPVPASKASVGTKRKVDDDSRSGGNKIVKARHSEGGSASHIVRHANGQIIDQSRATPRSGNSTSATKPPARKPSPPRVNATSTAGRSNPGVGSNPSRPTANGRPTQSGYSGTAGRKPSEVTNRPKPSYSAVASSKPPAAKPTSVAPPASAAPPKKGSFAEIMARGQKAQQSMSKVGAIQHKAVDKPLTKKDREAAQVAQKVGQKAGSKAKPAKAGYTGSSRPGAQITRDKPSVADVKDSRAKAAKGRPGSSGGEQEKKVKKSAMATTGYSGTSRPRPGASSNKPGAGSHGRSRAPARSAGGLLAPPKINRRNDYEEEYDEELDDFIDYDDEEEEEMPRFGHAPRYNYVSEDDESDMEAGMSDIDGEESRAERLARAEDKREQALEERLKREKEARKRRFG